MPPGRELALNNAFGFLKSLGSGRSMAILGVAIGVAATLAFTVLRAGATQMEMLFSDVEPSEAGAIIAALDQAGIRSDQTGDGSVIRVQRGKKFTARNIIAQRGLITSGSVGWEIFDQNTLGQTQFTQDVNKRRAVQGELERTIKDQDGVTAVRVLLHLPERAMFQTEAEPATASVSIGFTRTPTPVQVAGIQNLVAAAAGMRPESVVVVDKRTSRTLGGGEQMGGSEVVSARRAEIEADMERRLKAQIERIVGQGRVAVTVHADLNLNRVTSQENRVDPDSQVVLGLTTQENSSANGQSVGGPASTGEQLPGAGGAGGEQSTSGGSSETNNYDYTRTITTTVTEPGEIKRLSVAVALDSSPAEGAAAGAAAPDPEEIANLVKAAIGFDEDRRDVVQVTSVPFDRPAPLEDSAEKAGFFSSFGTNNIMRGAELLVLLVVSALVVFFVARPLLKGILGKAGEGDGLMQMPMLVPGSGPLLATASGQAAPVGFQPSAQGASGPNITNIPAGAPEPTIDIARIEGQVKASAVKQVSDFADRHPEESVSILRSWLHEG